MVADIEPYGSPIYQFSSSCRFNSLRENCNYVAQRYGEQEASIMKRSFEENIAIKTSHTQQVSSTESVTQYGALEVDTWIIAAIAGAFAGIPVPAVA